MIKFIPVFCFLVLFVSGISVSAQNFKSLDNDSFRVAIENCLKESDEGLCEIYGATSGYGTMPSWDTSKVTDMSQAFDSMPPSYESRESFNADIAAWDVSNVTNMSGMFYNTEMFNADIRAWDVSNVTDMSSMFWKNKSFNADIGDWDVSSVTDMSSMFHRNYVFNADIGTWDVSNVTNFSGMFNNTEVFNKDISAWNVGKATDMSSMFSNNKVFNAKIGDWDVGNVNNLSYMFSDTSFNQNINNWDISEVSDISGMLANNRSFNQPLSDWDVSNVTNMSRVFQNSNFNQDISSWDVGNVGDMSGMFAQNASFDQDIRAWKVTIRMNLKGMFDGATSMINTFGVEASPPANWFFYLSNAQLNDGNFAQAIEECLTEAPIDGKCYSSPHGIMPFWDTTDLTDMSGAFKERTKFNANISLWNVNNVKNMSEMFYSASSFDHDIRVWNVQNLLKVDDMFSKADRMKEVFYVQDKDPIDWFNTISEKNTSDLSSDCMKTCDLGFWKNTASTDLGTTLGEKFVKQVIGNDKLLSTDDSKLSPFLLAAKANGTLEVQNWIKLSLEASDLKSLGISKLHISAANGNVSEIKNEIENGTLQASEKLDGQNLWFSFRDGNPVFAYATIPNFDGITGAQIGQGSGYAVTTGKYIPDTGDGNPGRGTTDYLISNFFFFTVNSDTATIGGVKGGGYGCSVGPITIEG